MLSPGKTMKEVIIVVTSMLEEGGRLKMNDHDSELGKYNLSGDIMQDFAMKWSLYIAIQYSKLYGIHTEY